MLPYNQLVLLSAVWSTKNSNKPTWMDPKWICARWTVTWTDANWIQAWCTWTHLNETRADDLENHWIWSVADHLDSNSNLVCRPLWSLWYICGVSVQSHFCQRSLKGSTNTLLTLTTLISKWPDELYSLALILANVSITAYNYCHVGQKEAEVSPGHPYLRQPRP